MAGWTGAGWLTGGGARGFWLEALLIFQTQRIVGSDKREGEQESLVEPAGCQGLTTVAGEVRLQGPFGQHCGIKRV